MTSLTRHGTFEGDAVDSGKAAAAVWSFNGRVTICTSNGVGLMPTITEFAMLPGQAVKFAYAILDAAKKAESQAA